MEFWVQVACCRLAVPCVPIPKCSNLSYEGWRQSRKDNGEAKSMNLGANAGCSRFILSGWQMVRMHSDKLHPLLGQDLLSDQLTKLANKRQSIHAFEHNCTKGNCRSLPDSRMWSGIVQASVDSAQPKPTQVASRVEGL